ncbi:hypothetical protein HanRHA438_Chr05g0240241 [Helianthus annuus]|uniref:Uncharacterized protein n=1 Tax=Helianthus annuus TaxID=4232 RepID=A0A251USS6_HELAN|nr:hypothetical protein HanXRQr2_Chr05g0231001 [Helianthus annuus]KAF5807206.1 hypothetical protein HanXRQr2_Chr05g0231011 [Helianthus annuus]KAJ0585720.1 hypothetical protein HanHA89_Chr05g0203941 [Helianthus annuus]KAJ0920340.1 hypothetical protein HanRHA438_Chr05g0240241 [Helianthus annuus]KAJ0923964.1 hypothetical protein HanPSC8_Chr05g0222781 [Helianthus annuus]
MCFDLSRFRFVFVSVRDLVPARRRVNKSAGIRVKFRASAQSRSSLGSRWFTSEANRRATDVATR